MEVGSKTIVEVREENTFSSIKYSNNVAKHCISGIWNCC